MTTQEIDGLCTLKSMYDNDSILATANGKDYRIRMVDLIPMLGFLPLKEEKARKHTYLKVDEERISEFERSLLTEGEI